MYYGTSGLGTTQEQQQWDYCMQQRQYEQDRRSTLKAHNQELVQYVGSQTDRVRSTYGLPVPNGCISQSTKDQATSTCAAARTAPTTTTTTTKRRRPKGLKLNGFGSISLWGGVQQHSYQELMDQLSNAPMAACAIADMPLCPNFQEVPGGEIQDCGPRPPDPASVTTEPVPEDASEVVVEDEQEPETPDYLLYGLVAGVVVLGGVAIYFATKD